MQQGELTTDDSPEQMGLRLSGLVVKQQGILRVYNRIYEYVFNLSWVDQELAALRPYSQAINAWLASNRQDESRLLRGQALAEALIDAPSYVVRQANSELYKELKAGEFCYVLK